jgi:hypothetical protein
MSLSLLSRYGYTNYAPLQQLLPAQPNITALPQYHHIKPAARTSLVLLDPIVEISSSTTTNHDIFLATLPLRARTRPCNQLQTMSLIHPLLNVSLYTKYKGSQIIDVMQDEIVFLHVGIIPCFIDWRCRR